jgi:multiple sugar transport system substrate-binding protein
MAGMAAQSDAWDIVVGDSQWLGAGAINGWYVDLTQWVKDNKVDQTMTEAAMTAYAEYPKGSKTYWAVPVEGDALGFAYRKDLFEDPANKEAFKAKYGYDLDVPRDMQAFKDISEFFYNPDKKMYGAALYGDNGYDSLVMILEWAIWAFGGELGDYATYKVDGLINNEGGVMGTQWYRDMWAYQPPNYEKAFFNEANDVFKAGTVPITSNYFAFFPGLADKTQNQFADVTGFFAAPPNKTFDGKDVQVTALGGQGASIITFSKKQDLAEAWLSWFIKPETQMAWAKLGGFTCDKATLASDDFMNATPFNPAFATSMAIMKDFWAVPEYADLLTLMSEEGGKYVINGQGTAKTCVDNIAKRWTEVFDKAGYYK